MYKQLSKIEDKEIEKIVSIDYKTLKAKLQDIFTGLFKIPDFQLKLSFKNGQLSNIAIDDQDSKTDSIVSKFDSFSERYEILKNEILNLDYDEDTIARSLVTDIEEVEEFIAQIGVAVRNITSRIESCEKIRKIEQTKKDDDKELVD